MFLHPRPQQPYTEPSHRQCLPLSYLRPSLAPKHRRCVWRLCVEGEEVFFEKKFLGNEKFNENNISFQKDIFM